MPDDGTTTLDDELAAALAEPVPGPEAIDAACRCECHRPHPGVIVMWNHAFGLCCPGHGMERVS